MVFGARILIFCTILNVHIAKEYNIIIGVIAGHVANGDVNEDDPDGLMRKLRAL